MQKSLVLSICAASVLLPSASRASVFYWDPEGTNAQTAANVAGTWNTTSSQWSASSAQTTSLVVWNSTNAACFCAQTGTATTGSFTVNINTTISCAGIFNGPLNPSGYNVTLGGTGALSLISGADAIATGGSDGDPTIFNVPLTGPGTASFEYGNQVYLNVPNTYTGGSLLGYSGIAFNGIVNFTNGSFGTGSILLSNATGSAMVAIGSQPITIPNGFTNVQTNINPAITFNIVANPAGVTFSGPVNFTGASGKYNARLLLSSGGAATDLLKFSGTMTGTNGFTKYGVGMLELAGANTYGTAGTAMGTTVVSNGWLILANTTGSAAGVSSVLITNSGATSIGTLTGNGSMTGTVTNNGGSAISATNMAGGPATLTTGAQTWQPNSHYTWGISSVNGGAGAGWDDLSINGSLTINATSSGKLNIDLTSLAATGLVGTLANLTNSASYSWPILTASGGITGFNPANINLTTTAFSTPSGLGSGVLSVTTNNDPSGHTIYVNFAQPPVPGAFAIGAVEGVATSVSVAKIVSVASTINSGGSLTIASVTSPTANGATVSLSSGKLIYTSAANLNSDTINYVLTDGFATASGSISVTVTANGTGNNGLTVTPSGGSVIVQAFGIPGQSYYIQVASSVTGPWTDLPGTPVTANSLGQISYTVSDPTSPSYYRTSTTP